MILNDKRGFEFDGGGSGGGGRATGEERTDNSAVDDAEPEREGEIIWGIEFK